MTKKIPPKENLITIIFSLALLFGITQNIPGPLIPVFVEEFKIGFGQMGLILFMGLFFGMISAMTFGILSDKYNRKLIIKFGILILSCGILGIILSFSFIPFTISFCILNLGFGCLEAGITTGIAELGKENKSHILTSFTKFVGLGGFFGPLFLFFVLYFGASWRIIFMMVFALLFLFLFLLLRINYPWEHYHNKDKFKLKHRDLINPIMISGAFVLFFHNGVLNLFGSWLTTYFTTFGVLIKYSSIITSFYWLSVLFGSILAQKMIKVIDEKLYLIIFSLLSSISLIFIAFIENIIVKITFSFLLGLFMGGLFPILLSILFSIGPIITGQIFSFLGFFGYGSIMVFQLLTGYFVDIFGKKSPIYIQLASSGLCFIAILIMVRLIKNKLKLKVDLI